jgi:hypothetical protein
MAEDDALRENNCSSRCHATTLDRLSNRLTKIHMETKRLRHSEAGQRTAG